MNKEKKSYKDIIKATSIFGGVQVVSIIFKIIGSKFVAVLLGPSGIGILGLLNSSIAFISSITNFGIGASGVKDIAEAESSGNHGDVRLISKVIKRIVWLTGTFGALFTIIFSSLISKLTFGNTDYTYAFMLLSITLLINQISIGQKVLLQGLRKINFLAKATLFASFLGVALTIPLYYFYGENGIIPGIIVTSIVTLAVTWFFSNKLKIIDVTLSFKETFFHGKNMMFMGFMISLGAMMTAGAAYVIRIYINKNGGTTEVGLFNAGFAIINTYVGLVFTAMATDYYPRLAAVAKDNNLTRKTINQQAEISLLILSPILLIFLVFIKWFVVLLYSDKFIAVNSMIYWAALGVFFKAVSWSIGFVFLSKGESKLYFWNELLSTIYTLGFNILGYYFMGLEGLGISFLICYFIHFIQVYTVTRIKFQFKLENGLIKIFFIQFSLAILGFLVTNNLATIGRYSFGVLLILLSFYISYKQLDKKLEISKIIKNKFSKNEK